MTELLLYIIKIVKTQKEEPSFTKALNQYCKASKRPFRTWFWWIFFIRAPFWVYIQLGNQKQYVIATSFLQQLLIYSLTWPRIAFSKLRKCFPPVSQIFGGFPYSWRISIIWLIDVSSVSPPLHCDRLRKYYAYVMLFSSQVFLHANKKINK